MAEQTLQFAQIALSILSPVATVVAVVVANKLSLRRTTSEKLWELRRTVYGVILRELSIIDAVLSDAAAYIEEDARRYFSEGREQVRHNRVLLEALSKAEKAFTDDYLVCSAEFIKAYEAFKVALEYTDVPDDPASVHDQWGATVRKHRPLLISQAKREIEGNVGRK